jgi:hypothetical protein
MHFLKKMRYVPLLIVPFVCLVWAKQYYLNTKAAPNGSGTSSGSPYNNVVSVNTHIAFGAHDTILIACGCTVTTPTPSKAARGFKGVLFPQGSGALGAPITIDSFVDGNQNDLNYGSVVKPVIDAQGQDSTACILLYNQQYVTIKDMELKSQVHFRPGANRTDSANAQGYRWGILVDFDDYNSTTYNNISIINNTVDSVYGSYCGRPSGNIVYTKNPDSNFVSAPKWNWWWYPWPDMHFVGGIIVVSDGQKQNDGQGNYSLMDSILISGDTVREVTGEGILVLGQGGDPASLDDWTNLLENVRVHGNAVKHTAGDGIFVNGANNELIDYNNVFGVGSLGKPAYKPIPKLFDSDGTGAEVGIFVMQHKKGIIEYNQVDSTYMPCGDAQAIDNDGCLSGTTLIQYNYTANNAGGFFQDDYATYDSVWGSYRKK